VGYLDDVKTRLDKYFEGISKQSETAEAEVPNVVSGKQTVSSGSVPERSCFDRAFDFTLKEEGYYSNDPMDPGGETKYGISKRAHPNVDIANLTLKDAKSIYYGEYWKPIEAVAEVHPALAMVLFDTAVNLGTGTAIRMLQKAVSVREDGMLGPVTLSALSHNRDVVIVSLLRNRIMYYISRPHWDRFKNGWISRVIRLTAEVYSA
jgi:lysozyme family protein